jgi:hypothetical protein
MKTLTQRRKVTKSQGNKAAKMWNAVMCHRFTPTRHVASFKARTRPRTPKHFAFLRLCAFALK